LFVAQRRSRYALKAKLGRATLFVLDTDAIRPFVIGRKAWLFADTPKGAHASGIFYSLIETAKANEIEPYAYLRYIFKRATLC